jgi:predicted RecA/RadA family phage recombinase
MAVTQTVHADATDDVDKGVAVEIGNCAAACLLHCNAGEQGKIL